MTVQGARGEQQKGCGSTRRDGKAVTRRRARGATPRATRRMTSTLRESAVQQAHYVGGFGVRVCVKWIDMRAYACGACGGPIPYRTQHGTWSTCCQLEVFLRSSVNPGFPAVRRRRRGGHHVTVHVTCDWYLPPHQPVAVLQQRSRRCAAGLANDHLSSLISRVCSPAAYDSESRSVALSRTSSLHCSSAASAVSEAGTPARTIRLLL